MGVILGSAVVPIALAITWKKANKWGCIGGSLAGFASGIIAWLVTTATLNDGVINVTVSPVLYLLSIPMLRFDLRPAEEITKCSPVILQRLVLEGSSLLSLLIL